MTEQEINIVCAELDGAKWIQLVGGRLLTKINYPNTVLICSQIVDNNGLGRDILSYITSYDAILPLIQKQSDGVMQKIMELTYDLYYTTLTRSEDARSIFDLTPLQLSTALVKACGKWKE